MKMELTFFLVILKIIYKENKSFVFFTLNGTKSICISLEDMIYVLGQFLFSVFQFLITLLETL